MSIVFLVQPADQPVKQVATHKNATGSAHQNPGSPKFGALLPF